MAPALTLRYRVIQNAYRYPKRSATWKNSMQVIHTPAVPPNRGRMAFARMGCTRNSNAELQPTVRAYRIRGLYRRCKAYYSVTAVRPASPTRRGRIAHRGISRIPEMRLRDVNFFKPLAMRCVILLDGMNTSRKTRKIRISAMVFLAAVFAAWLWGQTPSSAVIVNPSSAKWTREPNDPPGTEGVLLHTDQATGGMELMVRFPGGHVIRPHWHNSNERLLVLEGRLGIGQGEQQTQVDQGGYVFLPAHEVQYLSCTSKTRCTFYLAWDGDPASHAGPPPK